MLILHSISFDTINCSCCKDREDAKIPSEIVKKAMDLQKII